MDLQINRIVQTVLNFFSSFLNSNFPFFFGSFPNNILCNCKIMNKHKVLMDHSNTKVICYIRICDFTGLPLILISPCSGWYKPNSTFINVDFPAPFSPSKACISPLLYLQRNIIIRYNAWEYFRNVIHLNYVFHCVPPFNREHSLLHY